MELKKTVLIVDDDPRNIFALAETLKAKGFAPISCSDAMEATELLSGPTHIDLALLDMMMPEMDGYRAIPTIKSLKGREQLPVIAVTAQAMPGDREKCLLAGADDYISKPIDVDRLLQLLHAYID